MMRQKQIRQVLWLFFFLCSLSGLACGQMAKRRCLQNESCGTKERTVCYEGYCVPKVCEPGSHQACYTGPKGTDKVGLCRGGIQFCERNGSAWSVCLGEIKPLPEICDQHDNNCDGQIDETLSCVCTIGTSRSCRTNKSTPPTSHSCRAGIQYCLSGKRWGPCVNQVTTTMRFRLGYANRALRSKAIDEMKACLDVDRDCDGKLDLDRACSCQSGDTRSCYLGPPGTSGKGTCSKGTQRCIKVSEQVWRWGFCEQQRLPQIEEPLGCNGKDDDCDGRVDNQAGSDAPLWKRCKDPSKPCSISICQNRSWSLCQVIELCGNSIDDDCDGQVDETTGNASKGCVDVANK